MGALTVPASRPVFHRALAPVEDMVFRDQQGTGNGSFTLSGYAAVTGVITTLYESRTWVWREQIAPGAFASVLERIRTGQVTYPCVLSHEHDNAASIASTNRSPSEMGGLELVEDARGLRVFARLDPCDPDVQRLAPKIRNQVATQMSFAFMPGRITTVVEEDDQDRTIETDTVHDLLDLYDVTVCAHGAYPTTSADIRGLLAASGRSGFDPEGHMPHLDRAPAGPSEASSVAPSQAGGVIDRAESLADARRKLTRAVAHHKHWESTADEHRS